MATTSATGTSSSTQPSGGSASAAGAGGVDSLNSQDFLNMMITELQNQDPMQPMSNAELLQQVSQIRAIQSNDQLSTTLQSVLLGQNVATANLMINQTVTGLSDAGKTVTGQVDSVSIAKGVATLHIGGDTMSLGNVTGIGQTGTTTPSASTGS